MGKLVHFMRDTTEQPEGVETGTLKLVDISEVTLIESSQCFLMKKLNTTRWSTLQTHTEIALSARE